jgi:hypothetical protein
VDASQLADVDADSRRAGLDVFLAGFEADIPLLSDTLTRNYLTHLQVSRQYAPPVA